MNIRQLIDELQKVERCYDSNLPVLTAFRKPAMMDLEVFPNDPSGVICVVIY